jgi:hypothetical protein
MSVECIRAVENTCVQLFKNEQTYSKYTYKVLGQSFTTKSLLKILILGNTLKHTLPCQTAYITNTNGTLLR